MTNSIDKILLQAFQEKRISETYYEIKIKKWDHFSDFNDPIINIPMGADGVKFEAFEKQLTRNVRNICNRIKNNCYIFYPFREVDIEKEPANNGNPVKYRTLSIAAIRDSIVQSILYNDVLYEPLEEVFRSLDQTVTVSYAYRKGKSAPKAAKAIYSYLQDGYWFVFDADLSKFFDTIPHDKLLSKLGNVIGGTDTYTYKLVNRFVNTDRVLFDTYKNIRRKGKKVGYKIFHWKKPERIHREKGIPQGGVLSGMLANLYLHDFDYWVVHELSKSIDLHYVRYADDFVILAKTTEDLKIIHDNVKEKLESMSLLLNEDKTNKVDVRKSGLDFVGFNFNNEYIRIREKNITRFKERVIKAIEIQPEYMIKNNNSHITLKWLIRRINYKIIGFSGEYHCPRCGTTRVGQPRSWMAFFQVVTDDKQLKNLDKWIREVIYKYIYDHYKIRIDRNTLRKYGFKSLVNEKYRIPSSRSYPCLCELDELGLWHFTKDLYQGKTFSSLAFKRPFYVQKVDYLGIHIRLGTKHYIIPKDIMLILWDQLKLKGYIQRTELEIQGVKNSSQIVTLLSILPGVNYRLWPIKLYYSGYHPAGFVRFPQQILPT